MSLFHPIGIDLAIQHARPNDAFLRDLDDDLERFETIGNNDMVTDDEESEEESEDLVMEVPDSDDVDDDGHDGGSS